MSGLLTRRDDLLTLFPSSLSTGFIGDWDLPEQSNDSYSALEEPDYAKFENVSHPSVDYFIRQPNVLSIVDTAVHSP